MLAPCSAGMQEWRWREGSGWLKEGIAGEEVEVVEGIAGEAERGSR